MTYIHSNELVIGDEMQSLYSQDEQWVQPSITHYDFYFDGQVMYGSIAKAATSSSTIELYYEAESLGLKPPVEKIASWENLSDAELEALYAETAEEDLMLAQLGLTHYTELLKQEEDSA
jgi:hypothetical protein